MVSALPMRIREKILQNLQKIKECLISRGEHETQGSGFKSIKFSGLDDTLQSLMTKKKAMIEEDIRLFMININAQAAICAAQGVERRRMVVECYDRALDFIEKLDGMNSSMRLRIAAVYKVRNEQAAVEEAKKEKGDDSEMKEEESEKNEEKESEKNEGEEEKSEKQEDEVESENQEDEEADPSEGNEMEQEPIKENTKWDSTFADKLIIKVDTTILYHISVNYLKYQQGQNEDRRAKCEIMRKDCMHYLTNREQAKLFDCKLKWTKVLEEWNEYHPKTEMAAILNFAEITVKESSSSLNKMILQTGQSFDRTEIYPSFSKKDLSKLRSVTTSNSRKGRDSEIDKKILQGLSNHINRMVEELDEFKERISRFLYFFKEPLTGDVLELKMKEEKNQSIDPSDKDLNAFCDEVHGYLGKELKSHRPGCYICDFQLKLIAFAKVSGVLSIKADPSSKKERSGSMQQTRLQNSSLNTVFPLLTKMAGTQEAKDIEKRFGSMMKLTKETISFAISVITAMQELFYRNDELDQAATQMIIDRIEDFGDDDEDETENRWKNLLTKVSESLSIPRAHEDMYKNKINEGYNEFKYLLNISTGERKECPICFVTIEGTWTLMPCCHEVCNDCWAQLEKIKNHRCVVCRAVYQEADVEIVQEISPHGNNLIEGLDLPVKMDTTLRLILDILNERPDNKVIVFTGMTTGTRIFQYIMHMFRLANIPFINAAHTDYGNRLALFESSSSCRVLLCSLNMCATGLNLTQANTIIFLDPCPFKSINDQAIGRINRIGQTKKMTVYHMIIDRTIDTELRKLGEKRSKDDHSLTLGNLRDIFQLPHQHGLNMNYFNEIVNGFMDD